MYPKNKYGAQKTKYGGVLYHSKLEAEYAKQLDLRKKAKDILAWEGQKTISIDVAGVHICNYIIDFMVTGKDGGLSFVEIKGAETPVWKLKHKLAKALYKDFTFVVLKRKDIL